MHVFDLHKKKWVFLYTHQDIFDEQVPKNTIVNSSYYSFVEDDQSYRLPNQYFLTIHPDDKFAEAKGSLFYKLRTNKPVTHRNGISLA